MRLLAIFLALVARRVGRAGRATGRCGCAADALGTRRALHRGVRHVHAGGRADLRARRRRVRTAHAVHQRRRPHAGRQRRPRGHQRHHADADRAARQPEGAAALHAGRGAVPHRREALRGHPNTGRPQGQARCGAAQHVGALLPGGDAAVGRTGRVGCDHRDGARHRHGRRDDARRGRRNLDVGARVAERGRRTRSRRRDLPEQQGRTASSSASIPPPTCWRTRSAEASWWSSSVRWRG